MLQERFTTIFSLDGKYSFNIGYSIFKHDEMFKGYLDIKWKLVT